MPDRLFYYCSVGDDERKEWFEQMILGRLIYFRGQHQLNDPNDLRPKIIFEGTEAEKRKFAMKLMAHQVPFLPPARRLKLAQEALHLYTNRVGRLNTMLHEILDRIGVFCLSETLTEPQMWVKYAQGHRGVCIEFDGRTAPFSVAQRIEYTGERPTINRLKDSIDAIFQKALLTKGLQWSHEQEWRVIARWRDQQRIARFLAQHSVPEDVAKFMLSQNGPGHYTLAPGAVRSVTLGANVSPETASWVKGVLDRAASYVPLDRATLEWDAVVIPRWDGSQPTSADKRTRPRT